MDRQHDLAEQLLQASGGDLASALDAVRQVYAPSDSHHHQIHAITDIQPAGAPTAHAATIPVPPATMAAPALVEPQKQQPSRPVKPLNPEIAVRVSGLSKRYKIGKNPVDALAGVDLDIHTGEFVALTGSSGSGKSTLLQLIGGLDKPSDGSIEVFGQQLGKLGDGKLSTFRNQTIGFIFQFFYLQPFLSVQTNIEVPAMFAGTRRAERGPRSQELAATVGLAERTKHLPKELSGGQMQRAAIARALLNRPKLLLADEPTGNLDSSNATTIFELFRRICDEQGTTVVVVTHDQHLASMADRSVALKDGRII